MPKTRLTAKLCSTPTLKSPGSEGSPPTSAPSSVPTPPSPVPPAVPKSPPNTSGSTLPPSPTKPASSKPPPSSLQSTQVITAKPVAARQLLTAKASASKPQTPTKPSTRESSQTRNAAKLAASDQSQGAAAPVSVSPSHAEELLECFPVSMIPPNASVIDYALHKDACDSVSDSDSDQDDLPDAFSTTEVSSSLPLKGDAVWVKYRSYNYWPSLVLRSNPKSKKLHILFLDDSTMNGQQAGKKVYLKYNKQKILPYNHENKSRFEDEGKSLESAELRKRFHAALNKMVDYLTKRALGHTAACKAFLDEPVSSEDENSAKVKAPSPPSTPVPADQPCPTKRKRKKKEAGTDKEGEEPRLLTEGISVSEDAQRTRRKKLMTPAERRAMRKERNQPIVDFICSTEMKNHLTKVYRGQIPSERHKLYMQGSSQQRKIQTNSSGPIDDDDQLEEILDHIGNWHQSLTQQKVPNMDYLLWVWLPEAIIHAIKKVKRCGEKRAKEMFEKGIKMTKSEYSEIHDQLIRR